MPVKISSEKKAAVLSEAATTIRTLTAERDSLQTKLASIENRQRVEKLASSMIDKGLESGSVKDLADKLEKQAAKGLVNLEVVEKATDMVGPDMGKLASIGENPLSASSGSDFERFIIS